MKAQVQEHPGLTFSPYCTQIFLYASHTFACTCGGCRLNGYSCFQELWKTMMKTPIVSPSTIVESPQRSHHKIIPSSCFFMVGQNNSDYNVLLSDPVATLKRNLLHFLSNQGQPHCSFLLSMCTFCLLIMIQFIQTKAVTNGNFFLIMVNSKYGIHPIIVSTIILDYVLNMSLTLPQK